MEAERTMIAVRQRRSGVARGALMLLAGVVLCAQASPPPQSDVVVTGERLSREEARRRAFAYVRGTGVAAGERAVARWIDPVCPRVIGIKAKLARHVESRIRATAQAAGAPLASGRCEANVVVSFVGDGQDIARRIAARQPRRLAEVPPPSRDALLDGEAPVRWWYSTEVRGKDGDRLLGMEPPFVTGAGGAPGQVLPGNGDTSFLSIPGNSIVSTQTARALRSATVLVDANRAAGVKLDALADYVAFVSLAELRPGGTSGSNSILALFDGAAARALTEWDARFLRELYRMPLDRRANQQRNRLAGALWASDRSD